MPYSHEQEIAALHERIAALAAAAAHQEELHAEIVAGLNRALQSRDVIGQAKGIIMAAMHCDAEEAFQRLREQSQAQNRKLVEIATEIAVRVSMPKSQV